MLVEAAGVPARRTPCHRRPEGGAHGAARWSWRSRREEARHHLAAPLCAASASAFLRPLKRGWGLLDLEGGSRRVSLGLARGQAKAGQGSARQRQGRNNALSANRPNRLAWPAPTAAPAAAPFPSTTTRSFQTHSMSSSRPLRGRPYVASPPPPLPTAPPVARRGGAGQPHVFPAESKCDITSA